MTTSISKDSILHSLNTQINKLAIEYEQRIKGLLEENASLKTQLLESRNQIELLSNSLLEMEEKAQKVVVAGGNIVNTSNPSEEISGLLCQLDYHRNHQSFVNSYVEIEKLNNYESSLLDETRIGLIKHYFLDMFLYNPSNPNEMNHTYNAVLSFIKRYIQSHELTNFLRKNENLLNEKILDSGVPQLVTNLARIYFVFNLNEILMRYLDKVIDRWSAFDSTIDKKDFIRLIWLSFYLSKDKKLLHKLKTASLYLKEPDPDIRLYNIIAEVFSKGKINKSDNDNIQKAKEKVTFLDSIEIDKLYKSLNKRIRKLGVKSVVKGSDKKSINNSNNSDNLRKIWYLTKLNSNERILPDTRKMLQPEWIYLAVFKDVYLKKEQGYVLIQALSDQKQGKAYITPGLIEELRKKVGEKWVDIRAYQGEDKIEKTLTKTDLNQNVFVWPSTELKGEKIEEIISFNEESELKKLGYQITGSTKEKRWKILEIAVRQLGLKKVAYTIAQNVKLRKGQKNGEKKFSYAIGEWEYDLAKLKLAYYKNNFTWPTTRLK
ncbi:hypothetical protein [Bacillus sp. V5-8f]|uniref:hypothetical protein n=1 Tax=Bacillus sp. V5-8f TaxID=2053044 RepID=UPI000C780799|nr:hypothetical protein [Bacillus sp. V5-8f]PLT33646.1 hypothetical protein CUU64_10980 [Bacillus sp. V5-8f]